MTTGTSWSGRVGWLPVLSRLTRLVLPRGPVRSLALANLINSVGDGLFAAVSLVYLVRVVGLSTAQVTAGLAMGSGAALMIGVPVGMLADRFGARRLYLVLLVIEGLTVATYTLVGGFRSFVVTVVVAVVANRSTAGVRNGLIAAVAPPEQKTRIRAYLRSVTNTGTALGAGLAGLALLHPTASLLKGVLLLDALTFALTALVVARIRTPALIPASTGSPSSAWGVLRNHHFLLASAAQALMSLSAVVLTLTLPLWIVSRSVAPAWVISVLLAGSTVLAVILQVPVARFSLTSRGVAGSNVVAGLLLAAACSAFAFTSDTSDTSDTSTRRAIILLALGGVLRLLGELLQAASGWTMSFSAAPAGRVATYQAMYSTAFTAAAALGPLLSAWVVDQPHGYGWFAAAAFFACAGVLAAVSADVLARRRLAGA
jgi:MFS family permease